MLLQSLFSNWTRVAGFLLINASLAWLIKLCVIISTDGRIIDTGAAAVCMKMGLMLFLVGSTGIGNYLSRNRAIWIRIVSIVLSPVIVFGSILLIGLLTNPLFANSSIWYAQQEAPIGMSVVVYLIVGFLLSRQYRPATQLVQSTPTQA